MNEAPLLSSATGAPELQDSLQRIHRLELESAALNEHAIMSITDAAGNITFVNQKFIDISGYSEQELLGSNYCMLKSDLHLPAFYQDLWDTVSAGKTWHGELRNQRKDGAQYWVRATVMPQLGESGLPERYISICTDITELKHAKEKVRLNQALLRSVIDAIPDLIYFKDKEGRYLGCNTAFEQYIHSPEALILGKTDFDFMDEKAASALRVMDKRLISSGISQKTEEWITCPDGQQRFMETTRTPYWYGDKNFGVIGVFHDLTQRKLALDRLELFHEMIENTAQPIFLIDADEDNRLAYVNQAACNHWGASREELLTWRIPDWDPNYDAQKANSRFEEMRGQAGRLFETLHRLKDGSVVPVEVFANARVIGGKRYTFGSFHNISARKHAEAALRAAKEAAEFASRAKSDFLSSMSHELRTPMNAILGFAQLMESDGSCTLDQQKNLQQISKAGWHLLELINEVLDLARVESGDLKLSIGEVVTGEIMAECLALVSPLLERRQIRVENRLSAEVVRVLADYMRLKQVLINFLSNAIKYNREAGLLVVEAKQNGKMLALSVRDTGRGMTEDQLRHLFEPFTRFGDTGSVQGTGIGLSICKKLIERMNGEIHVESVVGEGSVFTVSLPLKEFAGEVALKSGGQADISLLYIENDAAQQSLLGKWARDRDWNIVFAHDASAGIDAAMRSRYDAILLDIDLPGGFGGLDVKSVFDEVETLRLIPVIGIGNLVEKADIDGVMAAGFTAYLTKPVDVAELARIVQTVVRDK